MSRGARVVAGAPPQRTRLRARRAPHPRRSPARPPRQLHPHLRCRPHFPDHHPRSPISTIVASLAPVTSVESRARARVVLRAADDEFRPRAAPRRQEKHDWRSAMVPHLAPGSPAARGSWAPPSSETFDDLPRTRGAPSLHERAGTRETVRGTTTTGRGKARRRDRKAFGRDPTSMIGSSWAASSRASAGASTPWPSVPSAPAGGCSCVATAGDGPTAASG